MARWTVADSEELYNIPAWGMGYFRVNERGHMAMVPPGKPGSEIDVHALVDDLQRRGITLPILIRFTDLIRARVETLVKAFDTAIREYSYTGSYRGVYPIKVNQERHLVEDLVSYSAPHHMGLEAGSRPELLLAMALLQDPEAVLICNGYKDREFIELALLARKMGLNCIIVVEKIDELENILEVARDLKVKPAIGVRARLSFQGSGHWQTSAGDRAKFGLTIAEILQVVERLSVAGHLDSLRLLHFHIGSQVSAIRSFKNALKEATRIYTELCRLGAPMGYLDVGGGLGVDYDGSRTNFESSMNYDVQEYAYDVVASILATCDETSTKHPHIITEAGRSMVAYNTILVFNVMGVGQRTTGQRPEPPTPEASEHQQELWEVYESISNKNLLQPYHDASEIREECLARFNLGLATIAERATIERLYWAVCEKLARTAEGMDLPEELEPVFKDLADIYYCNFSLFQSAPDSWAINQLFPICPIHRLDERPDRRAVLADLTCDSDGKIDRFIDKRDVKSALEVHSPNGKPYYISMFLLGAYQEILGDFHNLFGDTNAVHVIAAEGGRGYRIVDVVEGDKVEEVMAYVNYDPKRLIKQLRQNIEAATDHGRMSLEEGARLMDAYNRGLDGYTYHLGDRREIGNGTRPV